MPYMPWWIQEWYNWDLAKKLKEQMKEQSMCQTERVDKAKGILQNILTRNAEEGIHDNDVERVYNILVFGDDKIRTPVDTEG